MVRIESANAKRSEGVIESSFLYDTVQVRQEEGGLVARPTQRRFSFRTVEEPKRLGVMIVGIGGNNGTTVLGGITAHKQDITWQTRYGERKPNWFGSIALASTMRVGMNADGSDYFAPISDMVKFAHPTSWAVGGWDISAMKLGDAMRRAAVFDYNLQEKLYPTLQEFTPLPSAFDPTFVAENQQARADNVIPGNKQQQLDQIRKDIREFKTRTNVESVIVIWSANTERFAAVEKGLNDTEASLIKSVSENAGEISPSTLYAMASVLEGSSFINGSPQNSLVPGLIEMASARGVFVGGDDFKSGQTKLKSVLADFLVGAGIKPASIVSYNHLGNNDGFNLSSPLQFRSKEISKSNVVDDMVSSNSILYPDGKGPDHTVVIKYVPYVGDSKRALDEYTSEIFMHGTNTIAIHNTCEDSLLASPLILDLVIFTELFERVSIAEGDSAHSRLHPVLSLLSYLLKSPMVPAGTPVVNSLFRQRECILNFVRALVGLPPDNHMLMEHKLTASFAKATSFDGSGDSTTASSP